MFRKTSKLVGLLLLLILSFMYTNSVFKSARASDPIMQEVIKYKEKNQNRKKINHTECKRNIPFR